MIEIGSSHCDSDRKPFEERNQNRLKRLFREPFDSDFRGYWWGICLLCAAIHSWAARHSMDADGLSYLELASAALSGGATELVNGYWSPGFPALISIAFFLFRPSVVQEFPIVHLVNFLIFGFALWAFSFFFRYWSVAQFGDELLNWQRKRYATAFAFSTFLWFTVGFIGVKNVTPDLAVAATIFLAAGICCRLSLPKSSWKHCAALGFVLGVGYYFKAAMFPLGNPSARLQRRARDRHA